MISSSSKSEVVAALGDPAHTSAAYDSPSAHEGLLLFWHGELEITRIGAEAEGGLGSRREGGLQRDHWRLIQGLQCSDTGCHGGVLSRLRCCHHERAFPRSPRLRTSPAAASASSGATLESRVLPSLSVFMTTTLLLLRARGG